jgi:hypothetical protein
MLTEAQSNSNNVNNWRMRVSICANGDAGDYQRRAHKKPAISAMLFT